MRTIERNGRLVPRGLSLIEILVALAIAALLLLGLSQVFIGSKSAYRLQEGMSRSQENARFVMQYLEDNVRMAGYMGCANDVDLTTKNSTPPAFLNHLFPRTSVAGQPLVQDFSSDASNIYRFSRPIQGYEASAAMPDAPPSLGATGDWTPTLPANIAGQAVKGTDVLVLRFFSEESTPVIGAFDPRTSFTVGDANFVRAGGVYGISSCGSRADIFRATASAAGVITTTLASNPLTLTTGADVNTWTGINSAALFSQNGNVLNAEVHEARYLAIFVGLRGTEPVLKVADLSNPAAAQELADNVENMQLTYGLSDGSGNGVVGSYVKANAADLTGATEAEMDAKWRGVLSVRVGLLMRGQDLAGVGQTANNNTYVVVDENLARPVDGRFRDVYETTVALRNRLVNY